MKKTLSIILALILMFSCSAMSFAADSTPVTVGKKYTVTAAESKEAAEKFTFTPNEDGIYKISASLADKEDSFGYTYIDVDLSADNTVASLFLFHSPNFDSDIYAPLGNVSDSSECFAAKKNATFGISVYMDDFYNTAFEGVEGFEKMKPQTISFVITKADDLREIKLGNSYTPNDDVEYFVIKPTEDTVYNIWSYTCSEIYVYGSDGSFDGDHLYGDYPIDITVAAKKGNIYLVYASSSDIESEEQAGEKPVFHVVDGTTISPDVIDINYADDITLIFGKREYIPVDIYPAGARYNCKNLDVKVGNGKIASAEYDSENGTILIKGKRLGKTTLTVTEPISGVTAEVEVEVVTRLTYFIREVISFVSDFFESFFDSISLR